MTKSECLTKSEIRNPKSEVVRRSTHAGRRGIAVEIGPRAQSATAGGDRRERGLGRPFGGGGMWQNVGTDRPVFVASRTRRPAGGTVEAGGDHIHRTGGAGMRDRIRIKCLGKLRQAPTGEAEHWLAILRELDAARISTIHSFCSSLLRSHAVEAGIDPKFGLLDETLGPAYLQQAVKAGVHELLAADDADAVELVFEYGLGRTQDLLAILVQERYRIDFTRWEKLTPRELAQQWDGRWHNDVVPALLRDVADAGPARKTVDLLGKHTTENPIMSKRRLALLEQIPQLAKATDATDPEALLESLQQNARVQGCGTKKDWDSEDIYNDVKNALAALRDLLGKVQVAARLRSRASHPRRRSRALRSAGHGQSG